MKSINLFLLFAFLYSLSVLSQDNNLGVKTTMRSFDSEINIGKAGLWIPGKDVDNYVKGSLYLFPNWIGPYYVFSKNRKTTQLLNLNYNLKTKNLEYLMSNDSVFQYDLDQIDHLVYLNKTYKIIQNTQLNGLFFEVFNGDKLKIFKETSIVVGKGGFDRLTQTKLNEDKYVQVYSYYVFADGKYEKEKINKKFILKNTIDKADLIKKFVLKYKLNYTSDDDVKRILNYYYYSL
ncbi:hypothetical protein [Flavobacterium sp. K5-23]|uniref:hypothetical protein n=1 Tax=Flavobacterium sp. K5-23 TaxID=2746225 RepID=UPI00200C6D26|nr:hypothetical protein [Flavobacterium sp. K5-23]UQD56095.1 hypothetical protein FLAK523_06705 [Flavobacterium sp. K5-23]